MKILVLRPMCQRNECHQGVRRLAVSYHSSLKSRLKQIDFFQHLPTKGLLEIACSSCWESENQEVSNSKSYVWLVKRQDSSATDPTLKSSRASRTASMAARSWMIAQHREAVQSQDFYANKSADRKTCTYFENGLNRTLSDSSRNSSVRHLPCPVSTARGNPSYISSADIAKFAGCEFMKIRLWHLQCLPLCTSSLQVFDGFC